LHPRGGHYAGIVNSQRASFDELLSTSSISGFSSAMTILLELMAWEANCISFTREGLKKIGSLQETATKERQMKEPYLNTLVYSFPIHFFLVWLFIVASLLR
jgi:hypothetical protein